MHAVFEFDYATDVNSREKGAVINDVAKMARECYKVPLRRNGLTVTDVRFNQYGHGWPIVTLQGPLENVLKFIMGYATGKSFNSVFTHSEQCDIQEWVRSLKVTDMDGYEHDIDLCNSSDVLTVGSLMYTVD